MGTVTVGCRFGKSGMTCQQDIIVVNPYHIVIKAFINRYFMPDVSMRTGVKVLFIRDMAVGRNFNFIPPLTYIKGKTPVPN